MSEQLTFWPESTCERWWNKTKAKSAAGLKRLRAATCGRRAVCREWTVSHPQLHRVRVESGGWSAGYVWRVVVDDEVKHREPMKLAGLMHNVFVGFEHRFELDSLPCIIRVRYRLFGYEYELWVDGKLQ